jgi:hypothetical protein
MVMVPASALHRNKWAFLLISGISLAACSHKLAPVGHLQSTPVVADGIPDEWSQPLRFSNETYTLQYNVTNDSKNIYVCVMSRDEVTILRILRTGMTIYFDPKGEKNKDIGLHFPLRKQPDPASFRSRNSEPLTNSNNNGWKEELLLQSDYYGTTGFANIENGQFGVTDRKSPIQVAAKLNNQDSLLVCEAIIPLQSLLGAGLNGRSPKKAFSVGIVLNPPVAGGADRPSHSGGGGRGMGLGIRGLNNGGGSHGNGSGNSGRSEPVKEDASWYQFRLVAG